MREVPGLIEAVGPVLRTSSSCACSTRAVGMAHVAEVIDRYAAITDAVLPGLGCERLVGGSRSCVLAKAKAWS